MALGVLEILRKSISLINRDPKRVACVIILVLFPLHALFTVISDLNPVQLKVNIASIVPFQLPSLPKHVADELDESPWEFDPLGYVLWWIPAILSTCLLSITFIMKPSTISELLAISVKRRKTFTITALYVSVFIVLDSGFITGLLFIDHSSKNNLLVAIAKLMLVTAGLVVFVFASATCELSFVVSTAEKDCYGFHAVRTAVEFISGRKIRALMLMALLHFVEQVLMEFDLAKGMAKAKGGSSWLLLEVLVRTPIELVLQLVCSSVVCVLYFECRNERDAKNRVV